MHAPMYCAAIHLRRMAIGSLLGLSLALAAAVSPASAWAGDDAWPGSVARIATERATESAIVDRVDRAVSASGLGRTTGVVVWRAESQAIIYRYRSFRSVVPASNQKLYTSVAALSSLGHDYRFTTRVALRGSQSGDTFTGDVFLVGGGDPMLATPAFSLRNLGGNGTDLTQLVAPLRARGIRRIRGRLIVDDRFLDRERYVASWPSRYRFDEATALGALTVNQSYLGRSLTGPSSHTPDLRAGALFLAALRYRGITVTRGVATGRKPTDAMVVGTVSSVPLRSIVRFMNRTSDNFTAEILLKDLGRLRGGYGSTARGARVVRSQVARLGVDVADVRVADGSGLSSLNHTTTRNIAELVNTADHTAGVTTSFVSSLAVSGRGDGTLEDRLTSYPYRGRVRAKTGTLNQASALSGFATRLSGSRYGFSVVTYDSGGISWSRSRALQDLVAQILVK